MPRGDAGSAAGGANLEESVRKRALQRAVAALAEFYRLGYTHGDAMAENVSIDLNRSGTLVRLRDRHDSGRPLAWRRVDDVRALLATTLLRTTSAKRAEMLALILNAYAHDEVIRILATSFSSILRRPLTFHLARARCPFTHSWKSAGC